MKLIYYLYWYTYIKIFVREQFNLNLNGLGWIMTLSDMKMQWSNFKSLASNLSISQQNSNVYRNKVIEIYHWRVQWGW